MVARVDGFLHHASFDEAFQPDKPAPSGWRSSDLLTCRRNTWQSLCVEHGIFSRFARSEEPNRGPATTQGRLDSAIV